MSQDKESKQFNRRVRVIDPGHNCDQEETYEHHDRGQLRIIKADQPVMFDWPRDAKGQIIYAGDTVQYRDEERYVDAMEFGSRGPCVRLSGQAIYAGKPKWPHEYALSEQMILIAGDRTAW